MNRNFMLIAVRLAWAVLLSTPAITLAQSPHEGIYIGTYHGQRDDGEFALIVDDQGYGKLAAFDAVDAAGYIEENIRVSSDGSFGFVARQGIRVNGQLTAGRVMGHYSEGSRTGSFTGRRMPDDGPLREVAGFFYGPVTLTGADSEVVLHSHLLAIVAPDGTAFFLLKRGYRNGADVFPDGFDLDLDFGSSFPVGPGPGSLFPFGPGTGLPAGIGAGFNSMFPFGSGIGSSFNIGPGLGFSSSWGWGNGFSNSLNFGPFLEIESTYYIGSGFCGLGWPFNVGLTFSISVSLFGSVDIAFNTGPSDCSSLAPWSGLWLPVGVAGGVVQIAPDGTIQASLPGGLALQGVLDPVSGLAEGVLSHQERRASWIGNWSVDRFGFGGSHPAARHYGPLSDFNDDGFADILWQDEVSGANVAWLMDGPYTSSALTLVYPGRPGERAVGELVAVRDLDGDHEPDPVWRHTVTGEILAEISGRAEAVRIELSPAWQIVGSGAFLTESPTELLVRHRGTGANAVIADLAGQAELIMLPAMDDQGWSSVALADFDGNGSTDILWARQSSRELRMWLIDDATVARDVHVSSGNRSRYLLAGVGDFDGDASADLLWRRSEDGELLAALGPAIEAAEDVKLVGNVGPHWQVVAVGDLDGDGNDDLVWRNLLSGDNAAWMIVNVQVASTALLERMDGLFWNVRN